MSAGSIPAASWEWSRRFLFATRASCGRSVVLIESRCRYEQESNVVPCHAAALSLPQVIASPADGGSAFQAGLLTYMPVQLQLPFLSSVAAHFNAALRNAEAPRFQQLAFRDADSLKSSFSRDGDVRRRLAEGQVFEVGGYAFRVRWSSDYRAAYLQPFGEAAKRRDSTFEREVAHAMKANGLREAMTCTIDGGALRRYGLFITLGQPSVSTHSAPYGTGLISITGVEGLCFRMQADSTGRADWVALDMRDRSPLTRLREFLQSLCRTRAYQMAQKERREWLETLRRHFPADGDGRPLALRPQGESTRPAGSGEATADDVRASSRAVIDALSRRLRDLALTYRLAPCRIAPDHVSGGPREVATGFQHWAERELALMQGGERLTAARLAQTERNVALLETLADWIIEPPPDDVERGERMLAAARIWAAASGSHTLRLEGYRLSSLPNDLFAHFPGLALRRVVIRGTRFPEVPAALRALPATCVVEMRDNQPPLSRPDGFQARFQLPPLQVAVALNRLAAPPLRFGHAMSPFYADLLQGAIEDARNLQAGGPERRNDIWAPRHIREASAVLTRRWPSVAPKCDLTKIVLLWHPELTDQQAQQLANDWDALLQQDKRASGDGAGGDATEVENGRPGPEGEALQTPGARSFGELLARLSDAGEFMETVARFKQGVAPLPADRHAIERVQNLLRAVKEDRALRNDCFSLAHEGLSECGDRVALYFGLIEAQCKIHEIRLKDGDQGSAAAVKSRLELGRKLFRLDGLMKAFQDYASSRLLDDPVEHRLHFQLGCQRRGLEFPVMVEVIRYSAQVPDDVVDQAVAQIRRDEDDVAKLAEFIAQLPFWRSYLEINHAARFEAAEAELEGDLRALGVLEMVEGGMEVDEEDIVAAAGKDAGYFHRKYPTITAGASPSALDQGQRALLRDLIPDAKRKIRQDMCRELTMELLGQRSVPHAVLDIGPRDSNS